MDEWDDFPFWYLGKWGLKETFAGVLTAGRVAKVAFDKAGIPAHMLYHNHVNLVRLPASPCRCLLQDPAP